MHTCIHAQTHHTYTHAHNEVHLKRMLQFNAYNIKHLAYKLK